MAPTEFETPGFESIVEDFDFLDDWEDRYRYLIELGRKLPAFPDAWRSDAFKVEGCASQVWIVPRIDGTGGKARFGFDGDSDALIVRGLIAVLHALFDGMTVQQVQATDARAQLARLGLDQHLSSQRSNGLRSMIRRIHTIASQIADA